MTLIREADSILYTKILPSPTCPVCAAFFIVFTTSCSSISGTTTSTTRRGMDPAESYIYMPL